MRHQMMSRHRWIIIPFIILGLTAFSLLTMLLWNALMPVIFHLPQLSFVQAIGILILSKILFGGHFGPHHRGGPFGIRHKIASMTPEEREVFFKNLHERRSNWWEKHREAYQGGTENKPV